jgi:hypothetical protein
VILVPFFWQQQLAFYTPSSSFTLDTSTAWHSLGTMDFPLSTFHTSQGASIDPHFLTQIGFMAIIQSPTPMVVTAHVGIDNIHLQVIPTPAAGALLFAGLLIRRRR